MGLDLTAQDPAQLGGVELGGAGQDPAGDLPGGLVVEGGELVGILSMRDVVRCWTEDGAVCAVPLGASASGG